MVLLFFWIIRFELRKIGFVTGDRVFNHKVRKGLRNGRKVLFIVLVLTAD